MKIDISLTDAEAARQRRRPGRSRSLNGDLLSKTELGEEQAAKAERQGHAPGGRRRKKEKPSRWSLVCALFFLLNYLNNCLSIKIWIKI